MLGSSGEESWLERLVRFRNGVSESQPEEFCFVTMQHREELSFLKLKKKKSFLSRESDAPPPNHQGREDESGPDGRTDWREVFELLSLTEQPGRGSGNRYEAVL